MLLYRQQALGGAYGAPSRGQLVVQGFEGACTVGGLEIPEVGVLDAQVSLSDKRRHLFRPCVRG